MQLNNYTVPGHNVKTRGTMMIDTQSVAGNSAATERTNNGIKAKKFTISVNIKFDNARDLKGLVAIAEATNDNGELALYDVVDDTINAGNVRQVQFTDKFTWKDDELLQQWLVSFTLVEYKSVAERTEQRTEVAQAQPQASEGQAVAASNDGSDSNAAEADTEQPAQPQAGQPQAELTGFEAFLSHVDNALAPEPAANSRQDAPAQNS